MKPCVHQRKCTLKPSVRLNVRIVQRFIVFSSDFNSEQVETEIAMIMELLGGNHSHYILIIGFLFIAKFHALPPDNIKSPIKPKSVELKNFKNPTTSEYFCEFKILRNPIKPKSSEFTSFKSSKFCEFKQALTILASQKIKGLFSYIIKITYGLGTLRITRYITLGPISPRHIVGLT